MAGCKKESRIDWDFLETELALMTVTAKLNQLANDEDLNGIEKLKENILNENVINLNTELMTFLVKHLRDKLVDMTEDQREEMLAKLDKERRALTKELKTTNMSKVMSLQAYGAKLNNHFYIHQNYYCNMDFIYKILSPIETINVGKIFYKDNLGVEKRPQYRHLVN